MDKTNPSRRDVEEAKLDIEIALQTLNHLTQFAVDAQWEDDDGY